MMTFIPTAIQGMFRIKLDPRVDERGYFSRIFCQEEFTKAGISHKIAQINQALTKASGTIRGLHWQIAPKLEFKVFRCIQGEVYEVAADVRPDSPSFGKWVGTRLSGNSLETIYLPGGVANGYQTLTQDCVVEYLNSEYYSPEHERGIRWDDPLFNITWPQKPSFLSTKDTSFPDFKK